MRTESLRIVPDRQAVIAGDGYEYPLSDRLFYVYLLLASERRQGDGWVGPDVLRRLPHWERNAFDSVGKQIRRHVLRMERVGRNIIQWQQRVKGPFRLTLGQIGRAHV